jgi:hypothetical protein
MFVSETSNAIASSLARKSSDTEPTVVFAKERMNLVFRKAQTARTADGPEACVQMCSQMLALTVKQQNSLVYRQAEAHLSTHYRLALLTDS